MDYKELKNLQEKAFEVFQNMYKIEFSQPGQVLKFLCELQPFTTFDFLNLPTKQLLRYVEGKGYGKNERLIKGDPEQEARFIIGDIMEQLESSGKINWTIFHHANKWNNVIEKF